MKRLFSKNNLDIIGSFWAFTFLLFLMVGFKPAKVINIQASQSKLDSSRVQVIAPSNAPTASQESIDIALRLYSIEIPTNAESPVYDDSLKDRGHTIRSVLSDRAIVRIGPAAFDSWGILGSTLAHEIEVHCNQSFGSIYILDLAGFDGTRSAEIEAYNYELANSLRFNLSIEEISYISNHRDYYFFEKTPTRFARFIDLNSKFFATLFSK